jgi:anti-sigma-K factor RskA
MSADMHNLTGAYAANALTADERELFERHLRDCAECTQEVRELQETASRLGAAAAAPVPAELRQRVVAEVAGTRQVQPLLSIGGADRPRRLGGPVSRWLVAVAACLAVALAGLGGYAVNLYQDLQQSRQVAAQVASVLTAPDAETSTASSDSGPRGTVVVSRERGQLVFLPAELPDVAEDRTYQAWLLGPGDPRSAGLLSPDNERTEPVLAPVRGDVEAVGLTVEPAGGSAQPTMQPLLVVPLPAA